MILTNCAACAAPLAHDAPRCIRCHTRYCNKTCHSNYARFLKKHEEYDKAKSLHRRTIPMARRALGDSNDITLRMRWLYANCLCDYKNATLAPYR